jgi:hypothetical protein
MSNTDTFKRAKEEHSEFVRGIGELMLAWSDLETVLYKVLKHYAGVTDAVGRAVFSGSRASAMIKFILAIAENTAMEQGRRADLEEIFAQVSAVNSMRDFVVHHVDGSEQEFEEEKPSERVLADELRVSRLKNARRISIGSRTLFAMRADCLECCFRLHAHFDQSNVPFRPGPGAGGVRSPWQYKAPQPQSASPRGA